MVWLIWSPSWIWNAWTCYPLSSFYIPSPFKVDMLGCSRLVGFVIWSLGLHNTKKVGPKWPYGEQMVHQAWTENLLGNFRSMQPLPSLSRLRWNHHCMLNLVGQKPGPWHQLKWLNLKSHVLKKIWGGPKLLLPYQEFYRALYMALSKALNCWIKLVSHWIKLVSLIQWLKDRISHKGYI